jgi:hypothetical protein
MPNGWLTAVMLAPVCSHISRFVELDSPRARKFRLRCPQFFANPDYVYSQIASFSFPATEFRNLVSIRIDFKKEFIRFMRLDKRKEVMDLIAGIYRYIRRRSYPFACCNLARYPSI